MEYVVACKYCGIRFGGPRKDALLAEHESECIPTIAVARTYDGVPEKQTSEHRLYLHPIPGDWPYASKGQTYAGMRHIAALLRALAPEQKARLDAMVGGKEEGDGDG